MTNQIKVLARELIPPSFQVPVKYWFGALRGRLENEMKILNLIVGDNDQVIDVGGNRGIYTYRLWKLGARVEVFEPNPVCSRVLLAWAAGKPSVNIYGVALSDQEGAATLHIPIDKSGVEHDASASIESPSVTNAREQIVSLRTLDSFEFREISLIKIDVEGHEYSVIEGAVETLSYSKPALLVEIEQRHSGRPINEVFTKILGNGYRGFFLGSEGLEALERFNIELHQSLHNFSKVKKAYINNFLFLHQDRLAAGEYDNLFNSVLSN